MLIITINPFTVCLFYNEYEIRFVVINHVLSRSFYKEKEMIDFIPNDCWVLRTCSPNTGMKSKFEEVVYKYLTNKILNDEKELKERLNKYVVEINKLLI